MILKLLGPHDLKPGTVPEPDTAIRGIVGYVKTLVQDAPLEFQLVIHEPLESSHKGPHKKASVSIVTGLKERGGHARPLRQAERALKQAMRDTAHVVLHIGGIKGCRVEKNRLNLDKRRREVELKLENGSRLQVVGPTGDLGQVIDFYSGKSVERLWDR